MNDQRGRRGRIFFLGLFVLLAVLVLYILSPFISVIAIAVVTVVMLKPLYDWILSRRRINGRVRVATTLTVLSFILLIIIPLVVIGFILFAQVNGLLEDVRSAEIELSLEDLLVSLDEFFERLPGLSEIEIDEDKIAESLLNLTSRFLSWLVGLASSLGTSLASLFIGGIIFLVVLATLLPTLDDLEKRAQELSPLNVNITQIYLLKGRKMISSVIKGVFLLAIIQGAIMGVFYWLAGVPFGLFFTLLSMAFAILPVVGISFIVLPMALIFILMDNVTSAVIVLIGFYIFVNPTDLTLRPRLVSKEAYLNFTLMLLALFGGLAVGGLLGMIYGPVVMVLFITTIDIYGDYFTGADRTAAVPELEEAAPEDPAEKSITPTPDDLTQETDEE